MKVWKQEEWSETPSRKAESDEERAAREKAVYYLQFSGKTECELRKKLADKEFSPASVDYAIDLFFITISPAITSAVTAAS